MKTTILIMMLALMSCHKSTVAPRLTPEEVNAPLKEKYGYAVFWSKANDFVTVTIGGSHKDVFAIDSSEPTSKDIQGHANYTLLAGQSYSYSANGYENSRAWSGIIEVKEGEIKYIELK